MTEPAPAAAPLEVRRATPADAATVQALLLELADHEDSAAAVHVTAERWRRLLAEPRVAVFLAFEGGEPLGYVSGQRQLNLWLGRDLFAVDDVFVRPAGRNRRVGERLMAAVAAHARAEGQLVVRWEMEHDNAGAQRFYRRLGAALRTKVIAAWSPYEYQRYVAD